MLERIIDQNYQLNDRLNYLNNEYYDLQILLQVPSNTKLVNFAQDLHEMFQQIPSCSQADRFNLSQARKQFDSEGPISIKKLIYSKVVQLAFKNEKPYPIKTDFKCKIKSYGECYCQFG